MTAAIQMPVGHLAPPIQAGIDSITASIEPACRRLATVRVRAHGSAIQTVVDVIAAHVRAPLDAVAATIEPLLDTIAASVQAVAGHHGVIGPRLAAHQAEPQAKPNRTAFHD